MTDIKDQEIRFLGDLQRLEVHPGDRFVLTVPGRISAEAIQRLQSEWDNLNISPSKLIVLEQGAKLGVIGTGNGSTE